MTSWRRLVSLLLSCWPEPLENDVVEEGDADHNRHEQQEVGDRCGISEVECTPGEEGMEGPLYWVAITSIKLPIDVNGGPVYLPWIDFTPSAHAWRELFINDFEDTSRAYLNSIVIALCATALCVTIGSMAAYGLSRLHYKPKFGMIAIFVLCMAAAAIVVGRWGVDWRLSFAVALALFYLLARALGRHFKRWEMPTYCSG